MLKQFTTEDERIHIFGRTKRGKETPLFWTGSGFEILTDSPEVWIDFELNYDLHEYWVRVDLDGKTLQRVLLGKDQKTLCAFRNLPEDAKRRVRFLIETQPMRLDPVRYFLLKGVRLNGGLYELPPKTMNIEFVGDSLTTGEGLAGGQKLLMGGTTSYGLEGHYGLTIADELNADFRFLSQSGWGVYTSWDNCADRVMPKYYDETCSILDRDVNEKFGAFEKNDFKAWKADIVVINLGSNDGFALDNPGWKDEKTGVTYKQERNAYGGLTEQSAGNFENACIAFLEKVRERNPDAEIFWAYGMCDHRMAPYVEKAVELYRERSGDRHTKYISLPCTTDINRGSNGHPGVKDHRLAADILLKEIRG